jgi:hypothetical protein
VYYLRKIVRELSIGCGSCIDYGEVDKLIQRVGRLRSAAAVPLILEHARDHRKPSCNDLCINALTTIGTPAIPELTGSLEDGNPTVGYVALSVLGRIGHFPAFAELIRGEKRTVAALALLQVGAWGETLLLNLLEDRKQDRDLRDRTVSALTEARESGLLIELHGRELPPALAAALAAASNGRD